MGASGHVGYILVMLARALLSREVTPCPTSESGDSNGVTECTTDFHEVDQIELAFIFWNRDSTQSWYRQRWLTSAVAWDWVRRFQALDW